LGKEKVEIFWSFGGSGGHLYLIEIYGPQTSVFDVMEMSADYSFVSDGLGAMYPCMLDLEHPTQNQLVMGREAPRSYM
jgi:hypothetical protein